MSNSIAAAPSVLAQGVISALANKLPVLNGFSSVFTSSIASAGKTIQVPLIGTSTATEFGASGYLEQNDATVTSSSVLLKHFKVSSRFSPLDVREYGMGFFANNFVETAAIALSQKCMTEINSLVVAANSESLAGFICGADAIAVATALPFNEIPGAEVSQATDPKAKADFFAKNAQAIYASIKV